jgi:hypothetical protein
MVRISISPSSEDRHLPRTAFTDFIFERLKHRNEDGSLQIMRVTLSFSRPVLMSDTLQVYYSR